MKLLAVLPQGLLSRAVGFFAEVRLPFGQPLVNRAFARLLGMDLTEAAGSASDYPSVSALFSRPLRPGARSFPEDPRRPVIPVDGIVGAVGRLNGGVALQAKGREYSVAELLGDPSWAAAFEGGSFSTLYLSPRHYHRIHAPVGGRIVAARHIPGRLFPVNLASVRSIPDLFPRNERLVVMMDAPDLLVAVVAVGAFNVGRISSAFDPTWNGADGRGVTNRGAVGRPELRSYATPIDVERGEELMAFHLGSTVVLLMAGRTPGGPAPRLGLEEGTEVRVGSPLAGP